MGCLAEGARKNAMEMEWRKAGFPRGLLEINRQLIIGSEQITRPAEAAKGVVVDQSSCHEGFMIAHAGILRVAVDQEDNVDKLRLVTYFPFLVAPSSASTSFSRILPFS